MASQAKPANPVNDLAIEPEFDEKFSLWLDYKEQLEGEVGDNMDSFVHERAMDVVYDQKRQVEDWLCHHVPASGFEALCLLEIVRQHDEEIPIAMMQALFNAQTWLAQGILVDFHSSATPTGRALMDRTFQAVIPPGQMTA